jgi:hypothetical protein
LEAHGKPQLSRSDCNLGRYFTQIKNKFICHNTSKLPSSNNHTVLYILYNYHTIYGQPWIRSKHGWFGQAGIRALAAAISDGAASGLAAPALEKVTLAGSIFAAFVQADTLAGLVVDQTKARPFIIATQVNFAKK